MENHTFSEPRLLESSGPTWQVDVYRNGVSDPVGILQVNPTNFPPRKRGKKVVWRLPTDPSQPPKFGEHERLRLYELFKAQRKERRKKRQDGSTHSETKHESQSASNTPTDSEDEESQSDDSPEHTPPTSPPPGFADKVSQLSLHDGGLGRSPVTRESPSTATATAVPPENINMVLPIHTRPPPPPGLGQQLPVSPPVPPSQSVSPPPRSNPPIPPAPPVTPPIPLFFSMNPTTTTPAAFATSIAQLFITCSMTAKISHWLAYYHDQARSTLLVGSAQVVSTSAAERVQQWLGLTTKPNTKWECTGCTAQPTTILGNVLVVLAGRTVQNSDCLAYSLTLLLSSPNPATFGYQIVNEVLTLAPLNTNTP